ncbi:hypothetical protein GO986_16200 [Deinococcus sp. HMF7620]|uniref:DUF3168 domain-containing protein n=1 Tax=Deinococcus arboris TaxID=2682977 RepID=A0A7C9I0M1_9DEIO|nr:hypothetical protein [Deinococcus arboris]MVN88288.1 hypothetical protein [Deinococcus arboris]
MIQASLPDVRATVATSLQNAGILLGTYILTNGASTPALHVGDPDEGVTVQGLEVLIAPTAEPTVIKTFAGPITIDHYQIRLVAHDGQSLSPALNALLGVFRSATDVNVLQATERYPDQLVFTVTP